MTTAHETINSTLDQDPEDLTATSPALAVSSNEAMAEALKAACLALGALSREGRLRVIRALSSLYGADDLDL